MRCRPAHTIGAHKYDSALSIMSVCTQTMLLVGHIRCRGLPGSCHQLTEITMNPQSITQQMHQNEAFQTISLCKLSMVRLFLLNCTILPESSKIRLIRSCQYQHHYHLSVLYQHQCNYQHQYRTDIFISQCTW